MYQINNKMKFLEEYLNITIPINFIKTNKIIKNIGIFPESGNIITTEPVIYDKNFNLIKEFEDYIDFNALCIINENLVALSNDKNIVFLEIISIKEDKYETKIIENAHYDKIYQIIRGIKENSIISSDEAGIIKLWIKNNENEQYTSDDNKIIESPNCDGHCNLLLFNNILIVGTDKLYFYNIYFSKEQINSYDISPINYNSMTVLDKNNGIIAVGCKEKEDIETKEEDIITEKIEIIPEGGNKYDYSYKILMIGNKKTGKTSISNIIRKKCFDDFYSPTVGFEFYSVDVKINDKIIRLQIWDACGEEKHRSLISSLYPKSNLAMIFYSINSLESFDNLDKWTNEINKFAKSDIKSILIGNKADLEKDRMISEEKGKKYQKDNDIDLFLETSAKTGLNVETLFKKAAKILYLDSNKYNLKEKNENLSHAYILKINDINTIGTLFEISFDNPQYNALCTFQNKYLIIGNKQGYINIYDINKNYEFIKKIEKVQNSIYGIRELENNSFLTFGEEKIIKVWSL